MNLGVEAKRSIGFRTKSAFTAFSISTLETVPPYGFIYYIVFKAALVTNCHRSMHVIGARSYWFIGFTCSWWLGAGRVGTWHNSKVHRFLSSVITWSHSCIMRICIIQLSSRMQCCIIHTPCSVSPQQICHSVLCFLFFFYSSTANILNDVSCLFLWDSKGKLGDNATQFSEYIAASMSTVSMLFIHLWNHMGFRLHTVQEDCDISICFSSDLFFSFSFYFKISNKLLLNMTLANRLIWADAPRQTALIM